MNKLNAIVLGSLLSLSALSVAHAAETTASATWQASATKDSDSDLVVTPTRALNFVYSANTKAFNTDTGLFDVAIRGDHSSATSFKLEAIVDDSDNTLFSVGGEATKLKVGARFGGADLGSIGGTVGTKSTAWTTLVDSSNNTGVSSGLWNLTTSAGATANTEVTGQDKFVFYVDSAQDSTGAAKEFKDLTNSLWEGTVSVAFRATWG
ncbi:TPA: fimbrial protein [Enterobacter cloacae]|uniref:common pilus major fimbrillin subunit EcpA n=1 Tax=Enterobacter cloacae TaxID=550 RepID=UPI002291ACD8|nr:fimbrial protein [Enterobacter cloacae]HEG2206197.1 fimbrial protein [Enterobacter cloacae]